MRLAVADLAGVPTLPGVGRALPQDVREAGTGRVGERGHERVVAAYTALVAACKKHGKHAGVGGVYDDVWAPKYVQMGARFILGGSDQQFLFSAASARAKFLSGLGA